MRNLIWILNQYIFALIDCVDSDVNATIGVQLVLNLTCQVFNVEDWHNHFIFYAF